MKTTDLKLLLPRLDSSLNTQYIYTFSVFTPVHNAEKTIERVSHSLENQTFKDFEWIIINDGSNDSSHEKILSILSDSSLKIRYVNNVTNKHKMACFFQAIEIANGALFLTFDADDECLPNALEVFQDEFNNIDLKEKSKIIAVSGLCVDQNGNQIGHLFPSNPYLSDPFKSYAIDKVRGEKWGFTKTEVLKKIKYPKEFVSNGFMPEGIIWNLLAREGYQTKYINTVLRIYHIGSENSISTSGKHQTNFGMMINYIANFNWFFKDYVFHAPIFFLKNLYFLLRLSNSLDYNLKTYLISIDSLVIRFFLIILWPIRKLLK